jgi:molybdopterin molybdotransferase
MIGYLKAKKILEKARINISLQNVSFLDSLNRISGENIYSKVNYPAGNNSAFDGYAINSKDTIFLNKKKSKFFKIIKTIAAGDNPKIRNVKKFQTVEVMTGALIPKPFDTVIPIEQTQFYPNNKMKKYILINKKIGKNNYIRFKGSDFKKKELVISKGELIQASHILALKSLGVKKVKVMSKPNILFFSTGNEISEKNKINDWQVRNSNSYYIKSLSNNFLFHFIDGGILRDQDQNFFQKMLKKSLNSKADIVITSGAVSAGKFDFVPSIIKKFKLSSFFKGVAIRPGKPILFAKFKNKQKCFFGLPGNPISSAACFRFFVYPYLSNILNIKTEKPFKAILKKDFKKKKNFTRFLKAKLSSTKNGTLEVEILSGQESFKIKSFIKSNVWAILKSGKSLFKKGQLIECFSPIFSNKNIFN